KGKVIAIDEQVAQSLLDLQQPKGKGTTYQYILQRRTLVTEEASTGPLVQLEDDTSANIVHDNPSPPDTEIGVEVEMSDSEGDTEILNVGEEKGEDVSNIVDLEERTVELDEGHAGSDPGNTLESLPPPDEDQVGSNLGPSHVSLVRPNPEPMHEDFIAIVYPKVYESMKHTTEEHLFLENRPSSSGTLSSMKNLDDAFTYGHQFLTTDPTLAARVLALEQICANYEKKNKFQDQTTQALSSRIFILENHDLYLKIYKYINKNVKEAIQNALKPPVLERFEELSEFEMKEILRDRMFESGSYRSQPEHTALYEALEASIDRENREEFIDATAKSRKRRHDDQDPPPPPSKDSDQNKKKIHDSDMSASKQS
ncbi:hypothetical protein Tco_1545138, partial [Tanacetum coccineum]